MTITDLISRLLTIYKNFGDLLVTVNNKTPAHIIKNIYLNEDNNMVYIGSEEPRRLINE